MARQIPTVERSECSICRRPVEVVRTARSTGMFDPGRGRTPHRCPEEALIRFRTMLRLARWGDPRKSGDSAEKG